MAAKCGRRDAELVGQSIVGRQWFRAAREEDPELLKEVALAVAFILTCELVQTRAHDRFGPAPLEELVFTLSRRLPSEFGKPTRLLRRELRRAGGSSRRRRA